MGLGTAILNSGIMFVLAVILPLRGTAIAREQFGIVLILVDENTLFNVGVALTALAFITSYTRGKWPKIRALSGITGTIVEVWFFLLFLGIIERVLIPSISHTVINIQYMGDLAEVPGRLQLLYEGIINPNLQLGIPILGDIIVLAFGIKLVRHFFEMFETPTIRKAGKAAEVREIIRL